MTVPLDDGLPAGWSLELAAAVRRRVDGRVLVGGAPLRVLQLTPPGASWLDATLAGAPVSAATAERHLARRLVDAGLAHPRPSPIAGPSRADVAVVIPVRDMAAGLAATLAGIGEVGEVIVVDDGSRDPDAVRDAVRDVLRDSVLATAGDARVLRHETSLGPAAARERGWRATDRAVVAFVDAEVEAVPGRDWLTWLLPHLDDPTVGAVAPRVRAGAADAPSVLARYERARSSLDQGPEPAAVRPGGTVSYVPTTALVVRRAALTSVGGFDATLRVGEDVDLVWRLHRAGWRVRYDPTAEVTHPTRPTLSSWLRQRVDYGASAAVLAVRHGGAASPLRLPIDTALSAATTLLGRPLLGTALGVAGAGAQVRELEHAGVARPEAIRTVAEATAWSARQVADALRRPWWPGALALAVLCRRARPVLLAAVVLPAVVDVVERRPEVGIVPYGVLRLADDVAYGTGVWIGAARTRSLRALVPWIAGRRAPRRVRPATERSSR